MEKGSCCPLPASADWRRRRSESHGIDKGVLIETHGFGQFHDFVFPIMHGNKDLKRPFSNVVSCMAREFQNDS